MREPSLLSPLKLPVYEHATKASALSPSPGPVCLAPAARISTGDRLGNSSRRKPGLWADRAARAILTDLYNYVKLETTLMLSKSRLVK